MVGMAKFRIEFLKSIENPYTSAIISSTATRSTGAWDYYI